jgi:hypothetical protein
MFKITEFFKDICDVVPSFINMSDFDKGLGAIRAKIGPTSDSPKCIYNMYFSEINTVS